MNYQIINKNDIFIYFEVIESLEVKSVLDVGMFLKRIAAISRSVDNKRIEEDVFLSGVDLPKSPKFPVYDSLYNSIYSFDMLDDALSERSWEAIVMLNLKEILSTKEIENIFAQSKKRAKYILVDDETYKEIETVIDYKYLRDVSLDSDKYYILSF